MLKQHAFIFATLSLTFFMSLPVMADDEPAPLQGQVEETGIAPVTAPPQTLSEPIPVPVTATPDLQSQPAQVDSSMLQGSAEQNDLAGSAEQGGLQKQMPRGDKQPTLRGFASTETGGLSNDDPDVEDQEMQVEWDKWRNRFLRTVLMSVNEKINNPDPEEYVRPRIDPRTGVLMPRYPLGTIAWFTVQVTRDGAIKNLSIIETSGHPSYDRAVMKAIKELEFSSLLRYPKGSRRVLVQQEGGIKTATQGGYTDQKFGDVEKYREPAW